MGSLRFYEAIWNKNTSMKFDGTVTYERVPKQCYPNASYFKPTSLWKKGDKFHISFGNDLPVLSDEGWKWSPSFCRLFGGPSLRWSPIITLFTKAVPSSLSFCFNATYTRHTWLYSPQTLKLVPRYQYVTSSMSIISLKGHIKSPHSTIEHKELSSRPIGLLGTTLHLRSELAQWSQRKCTILSLHRRLVTHINRTETHKKHLYTKKLQVMDDRRTETTVNFKDNFQISTQSSK